MFVRCLKWNIRQVVLSLILLMSLHTSGPSLADSPPDLQAEQEEPSGSSDSHQQPVLRLGDLVRLKTILPKRRVKGVILSVDETQIIIEDDKGERLSLPWPSISHVYVQTGLRRSWGTGLLIGTGIGVVLGLANPEEDEEFCVPFGGCRLDEAPSRSSQVAVGAALGLVVGLIAVGSSPPSVPKWTRVQLPYRPPTATSLCVGIAPSRDGVIVGLVVRFQTEARTSGRGFCKIEAMDVLIQRRLTGAKLQNPAAAG